jgi:hypothetical protein
VVVIGVAGRGMKEVQPEVPQIFMVPDTTSTIMRCGHWETKEARI